LITRASGIRRVIAGLLGAVAAVCLFAAPARAALDADFNGDGIPDRVVLPRPPETNIVVRLSGAAPQVLRFFDRVISVVASDVDHDGDLDISALSERRGLFIWLNHGMRGQRAHFKPLKRKSRTHDLSIGSKGLLASAPEDPQNGPAATGPDDDRDRLAQAEPVTHEVTQQPSHERPTPFCPALPVDRAGASGSRAPPVL
jgi:hypothetical protein